MKTFRLIEGLSLLLLAGACKSGTNDPGPGAQAATSTVPSASTPVPVAAVDAGADSGAATAAAVDAGPPEEPLAGAIFAKQIQAAYRVAACGGADDLIPSNVDRKTVDTHCAAMKTLYADYKKDWLDVAGPFLAKLRPEGLPTTLVYPFGGGDLVSALATYPDATDITTISLEIAGDIRGIDKATSGPLGKELVQLRDHLGKLFWKAHSRTVNLDIEKGLAVPGEAAYTMAALVVHGYEPTSYRYFAFNNDGTLKWLTEEDIAKNKNTANGGREGPFANAEIRFRKVGDTSGKVRVLRHVAYDLSDANVKAKPGLIKFLESKGKPVSTMTKAASHLLWDDQNFAVIRDYLMTHTEWMISDTTGVPPRIAKKYGFEQDLYGAYEWPEPFGTVNNADATAFHEAFKTAKPISFRYGYPDNKSHGHIVVTHKPGVVTKNPPQCPGSPGCG